MLDLSRLEENIKSAFDDIFPPSFELALKSTFPVMTESGENIAKNFGEIITDQMSEPLAKRLAAAIDYYIRSGVITGTIVTVGSPTTQTAQLVPINLGNPTAGSVVNTLGIQ